MKTSCPPQTKAAKGLPSTSKSKPAATAAGFTVTARIAGRYLRAYEFCARHYNVPLVHLLSAEAYGQAACLTSDVFGALEWYERIRETDDLEEVRLEFCEEAYAVLSRAAELLNRSMDEFMSDLVTASGPTMEEIVEDGTSGEREWDHDDLIWHANRAVEFARLATWNRAPGSRSAKAADGWELFHLKRPEERELLLKLKGGRAS